jgi:hypothetical protein
MAPLLARIPLPEDGNQRLLRTVKGAEIGKPRISAPVVRRLLEVAEPGEISYGLVGITPGSNRSDKSVALAASPRRE